MVFFEKSLNFVQIVKGTKYAVECVSNVFISKKCLPPVYEVLWGRIRKLGTLEKFKTMIKKEHSFQKKSFHHLKSFLYKIGKAQSGPVVAGCLVSFTCIYCKYIVF